MHRLYDGIREGKSYGTCIQFLQFKRNEEDDIAAKLKNLWVNLQGEIIKDNTTKNNTHNSELPELQILESFYQTNIFYLNLLRCLCLKRTVLLKI